MTATAAGTPSPPTGEAFSFGSLIRGHALSIPDVPALSFGDATWTYRELDRRSSRAANALIAAGVSPGDRVAVLAKNAPVFYELAFACSKVGAILAGLNWRLAPPEIEAIVVDAEPTVVVVADAQLPLLTDAALAVPSIQLVLSLERDYDTFVDAGSEQDPALRVGPDDVVLLLYTSGTTGVPKGVELTNHNTSFTGRLAREVWGFSERTVNLVGMPMFHIGGIGFGMGAMVTGGHTVLIGDSDPATIVTAIARHRVTHAFFVPAVIQSILASPEVHNADVSSLELLVYGASPIGDAVLRKAIELLGCRFMQNYGMTETAGSIVALLPGDHLPDDPERAGLLRSCGRPAPWVETGLFDPTTGRRVSTGSVGEIWVRSAMVMRGYRNKPAETAATITPEGWLRTGDAAFADAEGYLYLFDRFKDMIVSGAENVYPAEVENALYDHPAIAEVAVIGIPHERWGETPLAIVVTRPGAEVTPDDLIAFARTRLARYKCPTSVEFVASLPRNASGKVLKKDLRAPFWAGRDRAIS